MSCDCGAAGTRRPHRSWCAVQADAAEASYWGSVGRAVVFYSVIFAGLVVVVSWHTLVRWWKGE